MECWWNLATCSDDRKRDRRSVKKGEWEEERHIIYQTGADLLGYWGGMADLLGYWGGYQTTEKVQLFSSFLLGDTCFLNGPSGSDTNRFLPEWPTIWVCDPLTSDPPVSMFSAPKTNEWLQFGTDLECQSLWISSTHGCVWEKTGNRIGNRWQSEKPQLACLRIHQDREQSELDFYFQQDPCAIAILPSYN